MFDVQKIANQFETSNGKHRWQAGGQGCMAVLFGFKRPADDDDSGLWKHPTAGSYHDQRMPAVLDMVLASELVHMGEPDLTCTLDRLGIFLDRWAHRVEQAFRSENEADGHPAYWERTIEVLETLDALRAQIRALTFGA